MSLTTCLKKAGPALHADDKAAILAVARTYRSGGLSADDAGRKAIRDQMAAVDALLKRAAEPKAEGAAPEASAAPATPTRSANAIFTDDAAEKARAILRKKLGGTLNSGIDPEVLQAGITLAGWHIEHGARTFAAYARAMLADMGDGVKPYLRSWYMAAKFDPRMADTKGMSTAAEVESADVDALATESDNAQEGATNVPSTDPNLERNRTDAEDPARAVEDAVHVDRRSAVDGPRPNGNAATDAGGPTPE